MKAVARAVQLYFLAEHADAAHAAHAPACELMVLNRMADIVDKATRSRMMSGIRGRDTKPELVVRRYLHRHGHRFRLHERKLPGRPDIVLAKYRTVVQVHGCFWHQHSGCPFAYMPKANRDFWSRKLSENVARDSKNDYALQAMGWRVLVIWECEVSDEGKLEQLLKQIRGSAQQTGTPTATS